MELGLASKVSFVGSIVEREILKRYYVAADLFLFPSLYDNAPLVIREAAALGTPSVLIRDSTASEINGFLSPNSTEAYSNRIREILCSTAIIKQVGEEASRTIARSWEDVAGEVYDRYNRLIKRNGNK